MLCIYTYLEFSFKNMDNMDKNYSSTLVMRHTSLIIHSCSTSKVQSRFQDFYSAAAHALVLHNVSFITSKYSYKIFEHMVHGIAYFHYNSSIVLTSTFLHDESPSMCIAVVQLCLLSNFGTLCSSSYLSN